MLGGVFICFNDITLRQHVIKEIEVQYFQPPFWEEKRYLQRSVELTLEALKELNIKDGDPVIFRICSGYINNAIAKLLSALGFSVERVKITGETQELVEGAYINFVKKLTGLQNLPERRFFPLLNWVRKNLKEREQFVKTGWKSWRKWRIFDSKNTRCCATCYWLITSGPHVGCGYGGKYHGWMKRELIYLPTSCPNWRPKEKS